MLRVPRPCMRIRNRPKRAVIHFDQCPQGASRVPGGGVRPLRSGVNAVKEVPRAGVRVIRAGIWQGRQRACPSVRVGVQQTRSAWVPAVRRLPRNGPAPS